MPSTRELPLYRSASSHTPKLAPKALTHERGALATAKSCRPGGGPLLPVPFLDLGKPPRLDWPGFTHNHSGGSPPIRDHEDSVMSNGTIARLLIDKGFGFIRDESGVEHFFHRSAVRGAVFELLREGQRVEFSNEDSPKGPRAADVRLLDS
jgi:CspA family cold shock protein